ncbi:sensor histidine kinase [Maledivibacter halophilus]|uniref:histidine kinase n=1 Tax=Maledivibacter halophilus TaxID=36842 RepID=A0A1T5MBH7_9FIRM|nr:HAMP domain-containing sensor histidine kinase [Maledivibacter halophilus]SKC85229.1 Signal transduction histidine kinase [Maledivibacter halophilus]
MKSIKGRLYIQNGIIIISIVLILEVIFLFSVRSYYFQSVERQLINKIDISGEFYNRHLINERINEKAKYILENDSKDPIFYMQVIDSDRIMIIDSNGLSYNKPLNTRDIVEALNGSTKAIITKDVETNEKIMAISTPLYRLNDISGVLRYLISIEDLEKMVARISWISLLIGAIVIIIIFLLSSFLANDIIGPIKELTNISEIMAKGDFSKRATKISNDEIGKLSRTLNYMAEEIQRSNSVKNEFISSISHELRTPLTAIQGWSEIILSGEVENLEEEREGLRIMASEAKRLSSLVEQLLDFSKFEAGKVTLDLKKVDINRLLNDIYSYFKKRFHKSQIKASLALDKNRCYVRGDVNRLKQVFINIIDNSIKFSGEKGIIIIRTFLKKDIVLIEIEDNGIGIPSNEIHKITEKFYRGKTKRSGSGIGLAICREIIDLHYGKFYISSVEGKGTKVSIELPLMNKDK